MKRLIFYLLPFLLLSLACAKNKEEKKLYPIKVPAGNTQYDFHYSQGRLYSVTTSRPNYYETITYKYYDQYFNDPEHKLKDYIFEINRNPDHDIIGWDSRDSILSKQTMLFRGNNPNLLTSESQAVQIYNDATSLEDTYSDRRKNIYEDVKHKYNKENQLVESSYYDYNDDNNIHYTVGVLTKRVEYAYKQGKLAKATYYDADKPYRVIELDYDDKPGYLKNLSLEARIMPLELPYRAHNIISYKVMDGQGKIRKDLSFTCVYTYNRLGYPNTFTQKMLDGREIKGYMVYKAVTKVYKMIASAK